jgi:hypothetical protein
MLAEAGASFEVVVTNDNKSTYLVRLFVDGEEAEPGYCKKLRPEDETVFRGWICGRKEIHEFLFAKTPVDDAASTQAAASSASSLGEVKVLM